MATKPDYYIVTRMAGGGPSPWRWELRRRSKPMGVKIGASGYQNQAAAEQAGRNALVHFLHQLDREEEQRDK